MCMFAIEYAKFRGSRGIVGRAGLVPLCHRAFVDPDVDTIRKTTHGKKFLDPRNAHGSTMVRWY